MGVEVEVEVGWIDFLSSKVGDHRFPFGGDGQPLLKFCFQEIGFVKIRMGLANGGPSQLSTWPFLAYKY